MEGSLREAIAALIFLGILLSSAALSISIARFRTRTFERRLEHDLDLLRRRAEEHGTNLTILFPFGEVVIDGLGGG